MTVIPRMTLEQPADEDELSARLDAAMAEYLRLAEAGAVNGRQWLDRQDAELRPRLIPFVTAQQVIARLRPPPVRTTPLALPDHERYSRFRLVGKGGMGAVYRATDALLERDVAVKVIHADLAADPADVERFLREARVLARLQHRNIIPVYDFGTLPTTPARPFFTMLLIEGAGDDPRGKTLLATAREYHAAPSAAGFQSLLTAFIGVGDAVAYAHALGVLHRDLKPANVLMLSDRDVLVVDWGLSKILTADGRRTTHVGGTPEYMPPEVARGAEEVGRPADVFGLGGILAVLLTGQSVYPATASGSSSELAARADTAGCLDRLRASGQPPELVALAERCLAVIPAERPTAEAVTAATVAYLASVEERAKAALIESAKAAERARQERRRRRLAGLLAVGAVAGVVLAALAGVWYVNDRTERRRLDDLAEQMRVVTEQERDARVRAAVAAGISAVQEQRFEAAASALERARGALGSQPPDELQSAVREADRLLTSALTLDEIRQELAVRRTDPQLPDEPVVQRYAAAFDDLGIRLSAPDAAERIAASPLRASLVIALDDWARHRYATATTGGVSSERLLELARAVDPDPVWRDHFRDAALRSDTTRVSALAAAAPVDQLTIAQTAALVSALPPRDPSIPRLLAAAEVRRPNDFWLCLTAAKWRLQYLRVGHSSDAQVQDALAYARTAVALRPDSLAALQLLAELYELFNQPAGLDVVAARMTTLNRDSWMVYMVQGFAARKRMRHRESLAFFEKAAEASGNTPATRLQVAQVHMQLGDYEMALKRINGILAENPTAIVPRAAHGMLMAATGQLAAAEKECRAVLAEAPDNALARAGLAMTLMYQGRFAAAETLAQSIPGTPEPMAEFFLAFFLLMRGEYAAVLTSVDRLEQSERMAVTGLLRFMALAGLGRFKEAKAVLDDTAKLQQKGGSPLAAALRTYWITVPLLQMNLTHALKIETNLGDDLPRADRDKIRALKGLERLGLLHYADVFLAKGYVCDAAFLYRLLLSNETLLAGMYARNNSIVGLMGSYRFNALRAAARASIGLGGDGFRATDAERAEYRKDALQWLKEELEMCQEYAARNPPTLISLAQLMDGGSPVSANFRLHLLKWHHDLEPIRDPTVLADMPEADQKKAKDVWAGIDELYKKLNPPLDIPGLAPPPGTKPAG